MYVASLTFPVKCDKRGILEELCSASPLRVQLCHPRFCLQHHGSSEFGIHAHSRVVVVHVPLWFQRSHKIVLGSNNFFGYPADPIRPCAKCVLLSRRHSASIAADGASIVRTSVIGGLDPRGGSEVETSESARFP